VETPGKLQTTMRQPLAQRLASAVRELEAASKVALACIFFGWFLIDTFVVTLGSLQHGVRFFDISAVIADPTRMFFGIQGANLRIPFGLLCLLCLTAPLLPHFFKNRLAWLAYAAPLTLMLICAALLYWRTSGEMFASPADASRAGANLIRFANGLVHQGSGVVARHIAIGVGGYVALIASIVLALRGARMLRQTP
jgi:hypothetical protein